AAGGGRVEEGGQRPPASRLFTRTPRLPSSAGSAHAGPHAQRQGAAADGAARPSDSLSAAVWTSHVPTSPVTTGLISLERARGQGDVQAPDSDSIIHGLAVLYQRGKCAIGRSASYCLFRWHISCSYSTGSMHYSNTPTQRELSRHLSGEPSCVSSQ